MKSVIQNIVDEATKHGFDVTIRNISYALMRVKFDDSLTAYTVIMGRAPEKDSDVDDYESMEQVQYLIGYFKREFAQEKEQTSFEQLVKEKVAAKKTEKNDDDGISFEENRAGIETQLKEILDLKAQCTDEDGKTDVKTMALLQKTEADLRVKLNDKFGASENSADERIVVMPRCNHICEWTNRECWLQTKEYAMEHWHLIDDPNFKK